MKDTYIVEIITKEDYGYEKYNGEDKIKAMLIYNEFVERNQMKKVELYKKVIISTYENSL